MSWTDLINGTFELLAGGFFYLSVRRIQRDKKVQGVHVGTVLFSSLWGLWNLPFYWALEQWLSLTGAVILAVINTWYLVLVVHYEDWTKNPSMQRVIAYAGSYAFWKTPPPVPSRDEENPDL